MCTRTERSPSWDFGEIGSRTCEEAMPVSWLVKSVTELKVLFPYENAALSSIWWYDMIFVGIFIVFGCPVKADLEIHATPYYPTPEGYAEYPVSCITADCNIQ